MNILVTRLTALMTPIMQSFVTKLAKDITASLTSNLEATKLETFAKIEETSRSKIS